MVHRIIFIFLLGILNLSLGIGQTSKSVTIQVLEQDTRIGLKNKGVNIINVGSGTTDNNGLVIISLPPGIQEIELSTPIGFQIMDPPGPRQNVPASSNSVVRFWVKTALIEEYQNQIRRLSEENEVNKEENIRLETELNVQKDLITKLEKEQEVSADSLVQLRSQLKRLESEKAELNDQLARTSRLLDTELRDFKAKVYGEISRNYKDYQNAIKNMEQSLNNIKSAFINPGDLELFNKTIDSLNKSRDEMDENYLAYVQYSRQYWGADKADNLTALYDQALEKLYKEQIIPLNNELISRLKAAWSGEKSRLSMQKQAWKYVKKNLNALNVEIQKMESMSGLVLKSLESMD